MNPTIHKQPLVACSYVQFTNHHNLAISVPKRRIFIHPTILLVLNALKDQNKVGYTIHFAATTSIIVHFLIGVVAINLSSTLQGIGQSPTAALVVAREVEKSWLGNQGREGGFGPIGSTLGYRCRPQRVP